MSYRKIASVVGIFLAAAIASPLARAQNSSSATPDAQSSSSAAPSQASSSAPKKVWTNDDVTQLRDSSEISTFGTTTANPGELGDKAGAESKAHDATWYHNQIAKLEAQLPPLDSQIEQLRQAIDGKAMGDGKTSSRPRAVKGDDWAREEAELQAKRDSIAAHIDTLRDQARHSGVAPNTLP
jgi:hypothetical protein